MAVGQAGKAGHHAHCCVMEGYEEGLEHVRTLRHQVVGTSVWVTVSKWIFATVLIVHVGIFNFVLLSLIKMRILQH